MGKLTPRGACHAGGLRPRLLLSSRGQRSHKRPGSHLVLCARMQTTQSTLSAFSKWKMEQLRRQSNACRHSLVAASIIAWLSSPCRSVGYVWTFAPILAVVVIVGLPPSRKPQRRPNFRAEIESLSNLLRGGGTLDIVKTLVRRRKRFAGLMRMQKQKARLSRAFRKDERSCWLIPKRRLVIVVDGSVTRAV